jgi:SET domain
LLIFINKFNRGVRVILGSVSENLGVLAGVFQLIAYLVYIRFFLADSIRPNPISWIMFAYGTSLMAFLEWRAGASWALLVLPVVCAAMSVLVALMCFRKGDAEPAGVAERWAFGADLGLTFAYIATMGRVGSSALLTASFVVASNLTTVTAFVPILLSTARNPRNERVEPWAIWTLAYGLLLLATWFSTGITEPTLLMYPIASVVLHGSIALLSIWPQKKSRRRKTPPAMTYLAESTIQGVGIFSHRDLPTGANICTLTGPVKRPASPNEAHPNWIGIGTGQWIDPAPPLDHINHSCEPNAALGEGLKLRALRPIAKGEEITMDYSTTEADFVWEMACSCGAPSCRKKLRSIQVAFGDAISPPAAVPEMQRIWYSARATQSSNGQTPLSA